MGRFGRHVAAPTVAGMSPLTRLTRFVLRRRRLAVGFWLALTAAGVVAAGPAFRSFSAQCSVPGREGYETNQAITRL